MSYWCPYCGEPLKDDDFVKGWRFGSPKGGATFVARLYQCHKCHRKVRVTEKEEQEEDLAEGSNIS